MSSQRAGSPGIREVALRANVSRATVTNVLNHPDRVARTTRKRVEAAMEDLHFVRNESARQLRAGRSRTVALVVFDIANPFFASLAHGAEEILGEDGALMIVCDTAADQDREDRYLVMLGEERVKGVLVTALDRHNPHLDDLVARGTAVVVVAVSSMNSLERCSVATDDRAGGFLAMTHLLKGGHTRVGYVGGFFGGGRTSERYLGAKEAVSQSGNEVSLVTVEVPAPTIQAGEDASQRIADMVVSERPTALFCYNDLLALGLLNGLLNAGMRVPDDVAIIGYDDIDYCATASIPLSSVRQPAVDIGRAGASLLLEEVRDTDRHRHRQVLFPPELIVRASSVSHEIASAVTASSAPATGARQPW